MTGAVVVDNETGAPLKVAGCGPTPTFAVVLGNNAIPPSVVWPARACPLTHVTVPDGRSAYPVTVQATYQGCDPNYDWGPNRLPRCPAGGGMPPLPPGDYRATFFQDDTSASAFPVPAPVLVRVRPGR